MRPIENSNTSSRNFSKRRPLFLLIGCVLWVADLHAQTGAPDWLENTLYGSGKMNTVIAVVGIILLGIGIWLFAQDRKLTRLEQRLNDKLPAKDR